MKWNFWRTGDPFIWLTGGALACCLLMITGLIGIILNNGLGVFSGLPSPFLATRYHSLVVDEVPLEMELTGWTLKDGTVDEIMGLRHKEHFVEGVQFHPESVLTEHGHALLANFINCRR